MVMALGYSYRREEMISRKIICLINFIQLKKLKIIIYLTKHRQFKKNLQMTQKNHLFSNNVKSKILTPLAFP